MNFLCTKIGKIVICFIITTIIYSGLFYTYTVINKKVIDENEQNEQNKQKTLQSFIDR